MKKKTVSRLLSAMLLTMLLVAFVLPMISTITVDADREYEVYIVVELKSVAIENDRDFGDLKFGELELATVVSAEGVKDPQTTIWPRKDEGSSWFSLDAPPTDNVTINMPIFLKKEAELGDEMAIVISAVDNDEKPGWLKAFLDVVFQLGGEVGKKLEVEWMGTAVKIAQGVYEFLDKLIPNVTAYGVYARILHKSEWESGYLRVVERAPNIEVKVLGVPEARSDLWVEYEIKRIQVPVRSPPLAVRLIRVTALNWAGLPAPFDEDDNIGEVFVKTRAFNDVAIKGPLVQMSEWGTTETGGPKDREPGQLLSFPYVPDWPRPDNLIYETDAIGAFLYLEVGIWDKDYESNNDLIALYCDTFWPEENWGIGQTLCLNISDSNLGAWTHVFNELFPEVGPQYVEIELEIYSHLNFSDVEVTIPTPEWEVKPGEFGAYGVKVKNWGNIRDYYSVTVEGINPSWISWGAGFDPSNLILDPGESAWGTLIITPPRHWSTSPGRYNFTVKATSFSPLTTTHGTDSSVSSIKVRPFYDVEVLVPSETQEAKAGRETICTIGVKNLGNILASFKLSVECLDFDESWVNLWPDTLWDLEPGRTGNGFLQISVPQDWTIASIYHFEITASEVDVSTGDTATGTFSTVPLEPGEGGIAIKLTEGLDYLFMENIKIRITALVTDAETHQPITGTTVTMNIYAPSGTLWTSAPMTEIIREGIGTGMYEWQSSSTIQDMMKKGGPALVKGVYLVHATTSYNGHIAQDIMQLHIDPPAEGTNYLPILITIVALLALTILAIKKRQTITARSKATWSSIWNKRSGK